MKITEDEIEGESSHIEESNTITIMPPMVDYYILGIVDSLQNRAVADCRLFIWLANLQESLPVCKEIM